MELLKNNTLIKHTAAIHINNILTLNQRKIANILLKNAYSELNNDKWHTIQVKDLLNQLGWRNTSNITETIKSDLRALNSVQLEWNILNRDRKKSWNITTFLSDVKLEQGTIFYSYSLALRASLYNPSIYAKLDLLVQKLFKTKHSLALWEYISCELSTAGQNSVVTKWMFLDDMRQMLGLQKSKAYLSFKILNQKVLTPSIEEINNKTNISISIQTNKEQRNVVAIRFIINKFATENTHSKISELVEDLGNDIQLFGLSIEKIQKDINVFGKERIKSAINYTKKQINSGKIINNIAAFYSLALRENWSEKISSNEIIISRNEKEADEILGHLSGPEIFITFMKRIRNIVGSNHFRCWFADLQFSSINDDTLTLRVNTQFKRDRINLKFQEELKNVFNEDCKKYKINLICESMP